MGVRSGRIRWLPRCYRPATQPVKLADMHLVFVLALVFGERQIWLGDGCDSYRGADGDGYNAMTNHGFTSDIVIEK